LATQYALEGTRLATEEITSGDVRGLVDAYVAHVGSTDDATIVAPVNLAVAVMTAAAAVPGRKIASAGVHVVRHTKHEAALKAQAAHR
jgi:hypothetical protein